MNLHYAAAFFPQARAHARATGKTGTAAFKGSSQSAPQQFNSNDDRPRPVLELRHVTALYCMTLDKLVDLIHLLTQGGSLLVTDVPSCILRLPYHSLTHHILTVLMRRGLRVERNLSKEVRHNDGVHKHALQQSHWLFSTPSRTLYTFWDLCSNNVIAHIRPLLCATRTKRAFILLSGCACLPI